MTRNEQLWPAAIAQLQAEQRTRTCVEVEQDALLCAHCQQQIATRFTSLQEWEDPSCEACFAKYYVVCPHCTEIKLKTEPMCCQSDEPRDR